MAWFLDTEVMLIFTAAIMRFQHLCKMFSYPSFYLDFRHFTWFEQQRTWNAKQIEL